MGGKLPPTPPPLLMREVTSAEARTRLLGAEVTVPCSEMDSKGSENPSTGLTEFVCSTD
jgi:hypothetical protein